MRFLLLQPTPEHPEIAEIRKTPPVTGAEALECLIGKTPDPIADRQLLSELRNPTNPFVSKLVTELHTREEWQHASLRELLPGLDLVDSLSFTDRLSVRAANCVARAGASIMTSLAALSPWEIFRMQNVGRKTIEEILSAVIFEWASAYLRLAEDHTSTRLNKLNTPLRKSGPSLAEAFASLERTPGFVAFKRRRLEPSNVPTLAVVSADLGVTPERVRQMQNAVETLLSKRMQKEDWPIRGAVDMLHGRLGSVAHPTELRDAIAEIDHAGEALPDDMPHRLALLLRLAEYHVSDEWVLGPDIESLTKTVLSTLTESGSSDLERTARHLTQLGVRAELQLPWIVSQYGFRIVDGDLVRA